MTEPARLRLVEDAASAPRPAVSHPWTPRHDVQFYDTEEFLFQSVASFLADGVRAGQPLIVIATDAHRAAFADRMSDLGIDPGTLVEGRDVVWLDAHETLSAFMEGAEPNPDLFRATVGDVFERMLVDRRYLVIRAYGEMVDLLWKAGNVEGAIALEELWNDLAVRHSFSLLCAYGMGNFFKEAHTHSFKRICAQHGRALPTEQLMLCDDADRLNQITLLQQRARALENEIHHRQELEVALRDVLAQRRRMEELLRRQERELRDFLDNANEGMHWVRPDGVIIWANRAELQMLGYSRNEYIGHHVSEFHADRQVVADMLTRLARNEELREFEATLVCKDGSPRRVLINSNVLWEDGKFVHTRCFVRDITGLKSAN